MKTIKKVAVSYLRIFPVEREVTSTISGTKSMRAGALILAEVLPHSSGQNPTNALMLSGKQIDNLASMHRIRSGKKGWNELASAMGVGKSVAQVSSDEHKKGDKYVDANTGEEKEYTKTSTANSVDAIILSDRVTDKLINATIESIVSSWDAVDLGDLVEETVDNEIN